MYHERTVVAAKGKWKGILMALGMPEGSLNGKHGPCPLCNSRDNFRFDNKEGRGSYICTCQAGDGMALAVAYTGKTFAEVASQIDQILGNITADTAPRPDLTEDDRRLILRRAYHESTPVVVGDLVHKCLVARGIEAPEYPGTLRFHPAMKDGDGGVRPCMIAMVGVYGEAKFSTMHRTFLRPDGSDKADMDRPRKLMPGQIPDGACVQLSTYTGGPLGIAEGIETAMAACSLYSMPVWSAINAGMMTKWTPPEGCEEVAIFGDNDPKFAGQAAAYQLAHRLSIKGIAVTVHIPPDLGRDWNDVWQSKRKRS